MGRVTHFFLGANSGQGFQSLFNAFCTAEDHYDLLVLKGGPGAGKSTMMRKIGRMMEDQGEEVEYLHCSGDPSSFDGVNIPRIRTAVIDGTAPHVIEPRYPAAVDRYVNLGRFYDIAAAKSVRDEIIKRTNNCSEAYRRAYCALGAARQMGDSANALAVDGMDSEKLRRRTDGIISRELRGKGNGGSDKYRFLGSITCKGNIEMLESITKLCERVYLLYDSFSLAASMLDQIHTAARTKGYSAILCPDPEHMERLRHILIPDLGLAFITAVKDTTCNITPYRRIHIDAMLSPTHMSKWKGRLKFLRKMEKTLQEEGISALKDAKAAHDALETLYYPYIDSAGLDAYTGQEMERILSYL